MFFRAIAALLLENAQAVLSRCLQVDIFTDGRLRVKLPEALSRRIINTVNDTHTYKKKQKKESVPFGGCWAYVSFSFNEIWYNDLKRGISPAICYMLSWVGELALARVGVILQMYIVKVKLPDPYLTSWECRRTLCLVFSSLTREPQVT